MNREEILNHPLYLPLVKASMKGRALPRIEVEFTDMRCPDDRDFDPNLREMMWVEDETAKIGLIIEAVEGAR